MRRALGALALTALLAAGARAEAGRTAAPFLQTALGAQAAGMGGAFTAMGGSLDGLQYNPGALATVPSRTLTSTYLNAYGSSNYGMIAYAHPFPLGTLAASAVYFNAGSIDLNLSNGTTGRVTAEEDSAWTLSFARELAFGLSAGASYRYLRLQLAETAGASSSQGDFGAHWRTPLRGVSLGAAYQYVGPDITFESAGDPPPRTFRYGIAFQFPDADPRRVDPSVDLESFDLSATADVVDALYEEPSPRAGLELGLRPAHMDRVALRLGWVFGRAAESFAFGLGLRHRNLRFDYSFGDGGELGSLQHLSLTLHFESPARP